MSHGDSDKIESLMNAPVVSRIMFTVTFPNLDVRRRHIPGVKLHSLAKQQLGDTDVIETIEHLFRCRVCFETYRSVRDYYLNI